VEKPAPSLLSVITIDHFFSGRMCYWHVFSYSYYVHRWRHPLSMCSDGGLHLLCSLRAVIGPIHFRSRCHTRQPNLALVFIPMSSDIVGRGIVFRPFVLLFIQTDLITTVSHEGLEQSQWNLQGIFISSYWWPY